jgi:hypothetical protein
MRPARKQLQKAPEWKVEPIVPPSAADARVPELVALLEAAYVRISALEALLDELGSVRPVRIIT